MSLIQFLQLLVSMGPQIAQLWPVIVALIEQFQAAGNAKTFMSSLKPGTLPAECKPLADELRTMSATFGGLHGTAFSIGDVLKIFQFLQQHPELIAAIQAIIAAFTKPTPPPQPDPNVPPAVV